MWIAAFILGPMLYMLSAPPLSALVAFSATRGGWLEDPQPDWLHYYEIPYEFAAKSVLLKPHLDAYSVWCWRRAGLIP
jgi:hypothetical protein